MAASIASKEIGSRLDQALSRSETGEALKTKIEQARLLVSGLSQMKGAAMKAGQALSIELKDLLPPEVAKILSELQASGSSLEILEVEQILKKELGEDRFRKIVKLSSEAIASASIGQVHSAEVDEQKVAIKVQFPGVADTVGSDLSLLKNIMTGFAKVSGRDVDLEAFFVELKEVLEKETHYQLEGESMARYREFAQNLTSEIPTYVIPRWIPEMSTDRVMTMSLEIGLTFQDWLDQSPPQEERDFFGGAMLDLYFKEFYEWGLVQTDPNFGNFQFRPKERQIVLLDFGATKEYSAEFRNRYRKLVKVVTGGNETEILNEVYAFGLLDPKESDECRQAFIRMIRASLQPFDPELQPFRFSDPEYLKLIRSVTLDFLKLLRHTAPPHQIIFLHRKLSGVFHLLKEMQASINLVPYLDRALSS